MDKMNELSKYLLSWIGLSSSVLLIDWSPRDQLMALCLLASVLSLSYAVNPQWCFFKPDFLDLSLIYK